MDITVKVLMFEAMMDGADHWEGVDSKYRQAVDIYCRHIHQRTGGNEKRSWKSSIPDYVGGAMGVFASMRAYGFDPEHPITLGNNLNLMDGAHRIACALVLRAPVFFAIRDKPGNAALWDEAFLRAHGMSEKNIAIILNRHARLEDAASLRVG